MNEREVEIREGKVSRPDQEVVEVIIIDQGEGLETGQPSNHDKVEVDYLDSKRN